MTVAPFTILIDNQEKQPFSFAGLKGDAAQKYETWTVPTKFVGLGPRNGDYSIEGFRGEVAIERKSMEDAHGTFLGFSKREKGDGEVVEDSARRDRFQRELANMESMMCQAVVVECSLEDFFANAPEWGKKPREVNAKILYRQALAWQTDYAIPWHWCANRRMAEDVTFRILARFWKHHGRKIAKQRKQEAPTITNEFFVS